jgi:hypothetical protein
MQRDGHARDIHQFKRSHADANACCRLVNRRDHGCTFFQRAHGVRQPRHEEPIDDEA